MLISLEKNIAIFAMAKTGTTALETVLCAECDIVLGGEPRIKHMQFRKYERFFLPYLESLGHTKLKTICVFREPEDWLGSWFKYRSRPKLSGHRNSTQGMSFETFVAAYLSEKPPPFADIGLQSRFICRADNSIGIDHLFAYSNFEAYIEFLEKRFGHKISLPRINVSPPASLDLSQDLRKNLHSKLSRDYEIYAQITQSN